MRGLKVFIGSSFNDKERVEFFKDKLLKLYKNKIHIYSYLEETLFSDPKGLQKKADENLQNSEIAIFILSKKDLGFNLKREINLALENLKKKKLKKLLIFYFPNVDLKLVQDMEILDDNSLNPYFIPIEYKSDKYVLDVIIKNINDIYAENFYKKVKFNFNSINSYVYEKWGEIAHKYVSRKEYEDKIIDNLFNNNKNVVITGFGGMGGVGKTAIMLKIITDLLKNREIGGILWFEILKESNADELLINSLISIIEKIDNKKLSKKNIKLIPKYLDDIFFWLKKENILVVIDSAEQNIEISKKLINRFIGRDLSVLVTSRQNIPNFKLIEIDVMSQKEALNLFKNIYTSYLTEKDKKEVLEICHMIGYHPLAIELIASKANIIGISKTKNLLKEKSIEFLRDFSTNQNDKYLKFVDKIIRLHYDELNESSKEVLLTIAIFTGLTIGEIIKVYEKLWGKNISEMVLIDNLKILLDLNLIKKFKSGDEYIYTLHPLIREFSLKELEKLSGESKIELKSKLILLLLDIYQNNNWDFIERNIKDIEDVFYLKLNDKFYIKNLFNYIKNFLFTKGFYSFLIKFYVELDDEFEKAWMLKFLDLEDKGKDTFTKFLKEEKSYSHRWIWSLYMINDFFDESKYKEQLIFVSSLFRRILRGNDSKKWEYIYLISNILGELYFNLGYYTISKEYFINSLKIKILDKAGIRNILLGFANLIDVYINIDVYIAYKISQEILNFLKEKEEKEIYGYKEMEHLFLFKKIKCEILLNKKDIDIENINYLKVLERKLGFKPYKSLELEILYILFYKSKKDIKNFFYKYKNKIENYGSDFIKNLINALLGKEVKIDTNFNRINYLNKQLFEKIRNIEIKKENISNKEILQDLIKEDINIIKSLIEIKTNLGTLPIFENWYLDKILNLKKESIKNFNKVELSFEDVIDNLKKEYIYFEPKWVQFSDNKSIYKDTDFINNPSQILKDYLLNNDIFTQTEISLVPDKIYLYPLILDRKNKKHKLIHLVKFKPQKYESELILKSILDLDILLENIGKEVFNKSIKELKNLKEKDIKNLKINIDKNNFSKLIAFSFVFRTYEEKINFYKKISDNLDKYFDILKEDFIYSLKQIDIQTVEYLEIYKFLSEYIDLKNIPINLKFDGNSLRLPEDIKIVYPPANFWKYLLND